MALRANPEQYMRDLFVDENEEYVQYLPVSDFFEQYVDELVQPNVMVASGQAKGARLDPAPAGSNDLQPAGGSNSLGDSGNMSSPGPGSGSQPGSGSANNGGVSKPKRKRTHNERQRHLNKLAQVRYRARKKAEIENTAAQAQAFAEKVAQIQSLKGNNAALAAQNAELEARLQQTEAELRSGSLAAGLSSDPTSPGELSEGGSSTAPAMLPAGTPVPTSPEARKATLDALVQSWLAAMAELRQVLQLLGLLTPGASFAARLKHVTDTAGLAPADARMMQQLVARLDSIMDQVSRLCTSVMRLSGAEIKAVMFADFDRSRTLGGWKDPQKWIEVAQSLDMTPQQAARVMATRNDMLNRLERIYTERQYLNQQAASALTPTAFSGASAAEGLGSDARLLAVLESLEENLEEEQRVVSEQEYVTFKHLLTPIQGALFCVRAFPDHCDCLALMHAVAALHGPQGKQGLAY